MWSQTLEERVPWMTALSYAIFQIVVVLGQSFLIDFRLCLLHPFPTITQPQGWMMVAMRIVQVKGSAEISLLPFLLIRSCGEHSSRSSP